MSQSKINEVTDQYRFFKNNLDKLEKRLSKEDEFELSYQIRKTRARVWFDLLGCAPFVEPIVNILNEKIEERRKQLGSRVKRINFKKLLESTKKIQRRDNIANRNDWAHQRASVAISISEFDSSNDIASEINVLLRQDFYFDRNIPKNSSHLKDMKRRVNNGLIRLGYYKNKFMKANVFLVLSIAKKYHYSKVSFSDLVQEGMLGLMKGIERFDASKGFKFSTYGSWWIRHAIGRHIDNKARMVRIPCHMIKSHELMGRTITKLEMQNIEPSIENIAEAMKTTTARVKRLQELKTTTFSLDFGWEDGEKEWMPGTTSITNIQDDSIRADELIEIYDDEKIVSDSLEVLDSKMLSIIEERYGFGLDEELKLREIGDKLGISRERVRQIQNAAIAQLKEHMERKYEMAI